ncbi:MAG: hypothetical protein GY749_50110 [Desulfobacteraceae bacterium]|nr:hypothetical protein [Desulfobacteraceae bacterium]
MNLENQVKELANIFGESRIRNTLKKLAGVEAEHSLLKIQKVKKELAPFEKLYNKDSEKAWEEFNNGILGDEMDIMEWMSLYENLLDFQEEHNRIINCEIIC